ncbi:ABC transporter ATP-binding protein [Janthinobacterium sp. 17J80-10]|uniref:ABC transporter ATP-binding protein n=1 Tax=Janthinobacterium sp. 17J80-10 TaxID=2497863 RepID=UPI0010053D31|nr:ABC transporter ATP-binding protein [Janthinobacterium sp. 17J80-10]QAU33956.1 ABC transporter ATP-binding protein [Janthinobacterium sp. 17J80-10]
MNRPETPLLTLCEISKIFSPPVDFASRVSKLFGRGTASAGVHALDKVSLAVAAGEVLGLVGESGCGKSTLGRIAAGLLQPSAGSVAWKGVPVNSKEMPQQRQMRLTTQLIFQDPYASLNPALRVADIIGEAPQVHGIVRPDEKADYVASLLRKVGLDPALSSRYPHQFSGGQRARIGIARALAVRPEFLVCDEAVAALDVSIQAQVINLFMQLRAEMQLSYLFISHDLGVVRHVSDRVAVMYLGRVVEVAPTVTLFAEANHPYTVTLLAAMPTLEVKKKCFIPISGEVPSPLAPPEGCHFHPRCPHVMPRCRDEVPALLEVAPGHFAACHLNEQGR